jgi:glycosyltransferase involved in cell wall biosynthesis
MKNSLIIILSDHPREHTSDYAAQTGKLLANDNTVITVLSKNAKSIKEIIVSGFTFRIWEKIRSRQFQYAPIFIIPFRRFTFVVRLNFIINYALIRVLGKYISKKNNLQRKYLWVFNPENSDVVSIMGKSYFSVYDCVDFHSASPVGQIEQKLIQLVNLVVVNSHILYKKLRKYRKDICMVPLGFRLEDFHKVSIRRARIAHHTKPIIGYIGGINDRLNYPLLFRLIEKTPQYEYVFVGPVQQHDIKHYTEYVKPNIDRLFSYPNVHHEENIMKKEIPSAIWRFDIAVIPYNTDKLFNRYCYPTKLFEYFYMGKPVIATPIEELKRFPDFVKIGTTAEEWRVHIQKLIHKPWPAEYQVRQRALATANSWERKLAAIQLIISKNHWILE